MPRITTFLAYDDQAEEAAKFYVSVDFLTTDPVPTFAPIRLAPA
ncbi:MAG: hypothetical protein ACREMB_00890 [Candidatus Rokuibacteriota bacterium]